MKKRDNTIQKVCIACGGELSLLGSFPDMPASAQDMPELSGLDSEKGIELPLCQCRKCGLVQVALEPVHYYKTVIRAGGGTSTMERLRHEEYRLLLSELYKRKIMSPRILEVGCGGGEFLKMWESLSFEDVQGEGLGFPDERQLSRMKPEAYGIEQSENLTAQALGRGLRVFCDFAENRKLLPGAPYDAFVQFNFLEHQPRPLDMLRTIHDNLVPGAVGLITVPSFEYILQHDGYYELLRDHIANYTEETLQYVLQESGFELLNMRTVNRDTLEAVVRRAEPDELSTLCFGGGELDISALMKNFEALKKDISDYLDRLDRSGRSIAIWGASHQGFTIAASTRLSGRVKYIIDSAPFKQGRYAPASHIPIVAPGYFREMPVDEILIVAPGYTDEIAGIIRREFGSDVGILTLRGRSITRIGEGNGCSELP